MNQSFRHRDMGTIESTVPSFSVGTTGDENAAAPPRRSTRRAAIRASTVISQQLVPERRSTRLNNNNNNSRARVSSTASVTSAASDAAVARGSRGSTAATTTSPRRGPPRAARSHGSAARGSKETPIVLDDDVDETNIKPAANHYVPVKAEDALAVAAAAAKPPSDFTCAICLDAPDSMSEVASISGCTHRFCFDCIDRWAETENKCPCCKARFRTIDRAVALPPSPPTERRGKRKRQSPGESGRNVRTRRGSASPASGRDGNVNSRTVEDRDQQSLTTLPINAAIVQQILESFASMEGGPVARGGGPGTMSFGTSEGGRPQIRLIRPAEGGGVTVMELILPERPPALAGRSRGASASAARGSGSAARGSSGAAGSGSRSSPRAVRFQHQRAPGSGSRRASSSPSGNTRSSSSGNARASFPPAAGMPPPARAPGSGSRPLPGIRPPSFSLGSGTGRASTGSVSARPAAAAGNGGTARPGRTSFANFLSSVAQQIGSRAGGNQPGGSTAASASRPAAAAAGSGAPPHRMTIRIIARGARSHLPASAGARGSARARPPASSGVARSSGSRSRSPASNNGPVRRSTRRSGSARRGGNGSDDEEVVVID